MFYLFLFKTKIPKIFTKGIPFYRNKVIHVLWIFITYLIT